MYKLFIKLMDVLQQLCRVIDAIVETVSFFSI